MRSCSLAGYIGYALRKNGQKIFSHLLQISNVCQIEIKFTFSLVIRHNGGSEGFKSDTS